MKKIFIYLYPLLLLFGCNNGYNIEVLLPNAPDGVKAYLLYTDEWPQPIIDSSVTSNQKITFSGKVDGARYSIIKIGNDLKGKNTKRLGEFFLENSDFEIFCEWENLPSIYMETPNKSHNVKYNKVGNSHKLYQKFEADLAPLRKQNSILWQEYLEVYHRPALVGEFNTKQGMDIVRKRNAVNKDIIAKQLEFVANNKGTVVARYVASIILSNDRSKLTKENIKDLLSNVNIEVEAEGVQNRFNKLKERVNKSAINSKIANLKVENTSNDKVNLTDYITDGEYEYTMVEFWASWCGPCRGEIPHLKHIHDICGNKLKFISVSLDDKVEDWNKAMTEENMDWLQLRCGDDAAREFGISGIPFCLILDKNGNIVDKGVRGAELDVVIYDLTNKEVKFY